jgi:phosphohistidine phosphatase
LKVRPERVFHSGKLRAKNSAAMLLPVIGAGAAVEVMEKGLLPSDSPVYVSETANTWREDTLIVGHQPFMSRLTSRLLLGAERPIILEFTPGTAACLTHRPVTGAWSLSWVLTPELLRR